MLIPREQLLGKETAGGLEVLLSWVWDLDIFWRVWTALNSPKLVLLSGIPLRLMKNSFSSNLQQMILSKLYSKNYVNDRTSLLQVHQALNPCSQVDPCWLGHCVDHKTTEQQSNQANLFSRGVFILFFITVGGTCCKTEGCNFLKSPLPTPAAPNNFDKIFSLLQVCGLGTFCVQAGKGYFTLLALFVGPSFGCKG